MMSMQKRWHERGKIKGAGGRCLSEKSCGHSGGRRWAATGIAMGMLMGTLGVATGSRIPKIAATSPTQASQPAAQAPPQNPPPKAGAPAPATAKIQRLILKDGSYQMVTKYQRQGDRVRYFSAERAGWEELPASLVDWPATEKWQKDRAQEIANAGYRPATADQTEESSETGQPATAAGGGRGHAVDTELDQTQPQVAPKLRLPANDSLYVLDTFHDDPELLEMSQSGGSVHANASKNIVRAAVEPLAKAKQTLELPGIHAAVQVHVDAPAFYIPLDDTLAGRSRKYAIVRAQVLVKKKVRVVGVIEISLLGKARQSQDVVATKQEPLPGGKWTKCTPAQPLLIGEYALIELVGADEINLDVWDFGVHPSEPEASNPLKAESHQ